MAKRERAAPLKRRRKVRPLPALPVERVVPLCGATDRAGEHACDRRKGHDGPHVFELVKGLADLRDEIADLRTPRQRERVVSGARRRCQKIIDADNRRNTARFRCGLDADHPGRCNAIITPDAPWFVAPCICPSPPIEPMCPQHGLVRHADRE